VDVALSDGTRTTEPYDVLVIATGASNGFWRHDRVEDMAAIEAELGAEAARLASASSIAIVGGGASGVNVADNLARRGGAEVHLFHSGDLPLPGYHPKVRKWAAGVLRADGVTLHPGHRAVLPEGFAGDRLTTDAVEWSTGQPPFAAELTLWAVGHVRPHSAFLPRAILDDDGFVRVDEFLTVRGHPDVFAVGDVAASDPHRSSARNWGWMVVVTNVRARLSGKRRRRRYRAPEYRWGSVLGLQSNGLVVAQPSGRRFRVPRRMAEPLLFKLFVTKYLYGGVRRHASDRSLEL
jgi:NADPH-dependent 2,4-dienoyl-CoA reductase/sulfur reductase-like enzyme